MQVRRRHQAKAAGKNLVFALHLGILSPLPELFNHPDVYILSNGSTHNTLKYSQVSFSCDTTVAGHTRKHTDVGSWVSLWMLSTPGDGGGSSSSGFAARSGPYSFPGLVTNAVDFRFLVNLALIWLDE